METSTRVIADRYEVIDELHGSANEVYLVHDRNLNVRAVLKLLPDRHIDGGSPWAEARILRDLKSPHVLPVLNADFAAGVPYLVTELAAGGSAADATASFGLSVEVAVRWTHSVALGLARTHAAGLLHRDIKPENVFIGDGREARLGDFGFAVLLDPATGTAPPEGTPSTVAPEVLANLRTDVLSDIYSVGATLYYFLAGRHAYDGRGPRETQDLVRAGAYLPLRDAAPHVPARLTQLVERIMHRDRSRRPDSANELAAQLGRFRSDPRRWNRTDEHGDGHYACWRGSHLHRGDLVVCALSSDDGTLELMGCHAGSGRRVAAACVSGLTHKQLPRTVRTTLGKLG